MSSMPPTPECPDGEPDDGAVAAGVPPQVAIAELLNLCEAFLRTAGPAVHDELRAFLTARGHHPVTGLGAFIDGLGFAAPHRTAGPRPDPAPPGGWGQIRAPHRPLHAQGGAKSDRHGGAKSG